MSPREQLSRREINVATMVWEGKTNPEIAACLGSSAQVIKNQLRGVFDKLGCGAAWSWLSISLPTVAPSGWMPQRYAARERQPQRLRRWGREWRVGSSASRNDLHVAAQTFLAFG